MANPRPADLIIVTSHRLRRAHRQDQEDPAGVGPDEVRSE